MKMRSDTGGSASDDDDDDEDADLGGSHMPRGTGPQMLGNDLASVFKD